MVARCAFLNAMSAIFATLVLLIVDGKHALEAIIVLLAALGGGIRTVNYALYSAAIAALVLIADDRAHPTNFSNEIERVLYTFAGLAIGVGVMFLADLLSKKAPPPLLRRQPNVGDAHLHHRCGDAPWAPMLLSPASIASRRLPI
jgi:uncharacterized membrane protein YccC